MRSIPDPLNDLPSLDPKARPAPPPGIVRQVRRYRLITPLVGGGVVKMTNDPLTLVRGPALRGQLRFWWRATRGGGFDGNLAAMRRREGEIWGAAGGLQQDTGGTGVLLAVEIDRPGTVAIPYVPGRSRFQPVDEILPGYVSFPLQPSREEQDTLKAITDKTERAQRERELVKTIREGVTFTLILTFRSGDRAEVEAALWAWETFGGVGARTRRGCGAIVCEQASEQTDVQLEVPVTIRAPRSDAQADVRQWLQAQLHAHIPADSRNWPDEVAHLIRNQTTTIGLKPATNTALESIQPWLDSLKEFRRPPNKKAAAKQKPSTTTRLASPLLIRPLAIGERFVGMAIILESSDPPSAILTDHITTNGLRYFPLKDDEESV